MFSQAVVKKSVHVGGVSQHAPGRGSVSQHALGRGCVHAGGVCLVGVCSKRGCLPREGVSAQGDAVCPGKGCLSRERCLLGGVCRGVSGGGCQMGVSAQEGVCPGDYTPRTSGRHLPDQRQTHLPGPEADTPLPRDGHCGGRYASYWNVFLSFNHITSHIHDKFISC